MNKKRRYLDVCLELISNLYLHFVELFGTIIFLLALATVVSLVSYCPEDPSLNTAIDGVPSNMLSVAGSYYADFMMQFFGISSYIFSVILLSFGYQIMRHHVVSFWKILSCIVCCVSASVLLAFYYGPFSENIGMVGAWIFEILEHHLHSINFKYIHQTSVTLLSMIFLATLLHALRIRPADLLTPFRYILRFKSKVNTEEFLEKISEIKSVIAGSEDSANGPLFGEKKVSSKGREKSSFGGRSSAGFALPSLLLLREPKNSEERLSNSELDERSSNLMNVLNDFGIKGEISGVSPGPVVTLYELKPAAGIKSSRVIGLSSDIARYMSAVSARVAVIPGRNALGIELPNAKRQTVFLRELLESSVYKKSASALPISLGKDISGGAIVADLAKMPHLLIAGTTGSGKSVGINAMILSLLYKLSPTECKFIMIDPKMLELSVYDDIPHLLTPVVTDPKKAVVALKWAVREMESRYKSMSKLGVRNIEGYNSKLSSLQNSGEEVTRRVQTGFNMETGEPVYEHQSMNLEKLPYIVIIVDEMADLMLVAGKDIEITVQRLAQMARAAGIHLIMATQRPSVDVITGTIKANFPTRISFQVSSKIDSRTILGEQGAEQLLGQGDMLYMASGGRTTRIHCPFVSDDEVEEVAKHLKAQGEPHYIETILEEDEDAENDDTLYDGEDGDPMYKEAVSLILREGKVSTSFIQRHLKIGYNRAARIVDMMETAGIVSAANHVGKREIIGK
ncbi:MAG: DNA translocase FtsK 4TM domain-containing protein [Holosporaceae bacterium]|jgi:S-DNA-T family DNA segregation ATPase FtsK/SpoIIIE|nr:DNA translocase FtsK 4TM domain-containing protein [Holosporaceae bacterium]